MTNAVTYIRCSSTGQLKKDGPERQAHATVAFTKAHNLDLDIDPIAYLAKHTDDDGEEFFTIGDYPFVDGVTGSKDTVDRPGWKRLLEYCEQHGINTILIENSSRLGREPIVCEMLLIQCRKLGLQLIDCSTGQDMAKESEDPTIRCLQRVMFAFYALEKDLFVHRSGTARKRIRDAGHKCDGRKGYRDKHPELVQRIRELRTKHLTWQAIADVLNNEQIPSWTGAAWTRQTVHGIINKRKQTA